MWLYILLFFYYRAKLIAEGIWNRAQTHVLRDDNEVIRNELTMIRNRNARLIEQLREKSMEHSKLTAQMATLQKQVILHYHRLFHPVIFLTHPDSKGFLYSMKSIGLFWKSGWE